MLLFDMLHHLRGFFCLTIPADLLPHENYSCPTKHLRIMFPRSRVYCHHDHYSHISSRYSLGVLPGQLERSLAHVRLWHSYTMQSFSILDRDPFSTLRSEEHT